MRPRLLVTGFGPFPGMARNPSAAAARAVAADPRWRRLGVEARALVLPTTYAALDGSWRDALRAGDFDAILMVGVAGRARRLRVEGRAVNRVSLFFPDAEKKRPARMDPWRGAHAHRARAGVSAAVVRLRRRGLPAGPSRDAGRYLCNAAYYEALSGAEPGVPVLFVHIPRPARVPARRRRRQPWAATLAAGLADLGLALVSGRR